MSNRPSQTFTVPRSPYQKSCSSRDGSTLVFECSQISIDSTISLRPSHASNALPYLTETTQCSLWPATQHTPLSPWPIRTTLPENPRLHLHIIIPHPLTPMKRLRYLIPSPSPRSRSTRSIRRIPPRRTSHGFRHVRSPRRCLRRGVLSVALAAGGV